MHNKSISLIGVIRRGVESMVRVSKKLHEEFYCYSKIMEKRYNSPLPPVPPGRVEGVQKAARKILNEYDDLETRVWATLCVIRNYKYELENFLEDVTGAKYEKGFKVKEDSGQGFERRVEVDEGREKA